MRSIGIAQLMMQAGMFAPAESFEAEVHESIITHFKGKRMQRCLAEN